MSYTTSSFSFPVLESGRADYLDDVAYEVSQVDDEKNSESIILEHKVIGNSFISHLLESSEAKFCTTIVLKSAMYRETIDTVNKISNTHVKQKIPLLNTFETHIFSSYIVYIGDDKEIIINAKDMGLDEFWDGATIELLKGSILAREGWRELENSASDLLTIRRDDKVKYGFNVDINTSEGGRFVAYMEPSLYDSLNRANTKNLHRRSIITHILCVGFMELEKRYKEEPDDNFVNFNGIKRELQKEGIKTWEDDEFNPNQIACKFLPHVLKIGEEDE